MDSDIRAEARLDRLIGRTRWEVAAPSRRSSRRPATANHPVGARSRSGDGEFAWTSSTCAWSSWRLISCTGFMTGRGCPEVWPGLALADTLSSGIRGIDILLLLLLCDASGK